MDQSLPALPELSDSPSVFRCEYDSTRARGCGLAAMSISSAYVYQTTTTSLYLQFEPPVSLPRMQRNQDAHFQAEFLLFQRSAKAFRMIE